MRKKLYMSVTSSRLNSWTDLSKGLAWTPGKDIATFCCEIKTFRCENLDIIEVVNINAGEAER